MKITMKCELVGEIQPIIETIKVGNIACQEVLNVGFKEKTFNKTSLHKLTYRKIRGKYPSLNSSYVTAIRDQASDMLKRLKLKKLPLKKENTSIRLNHNTFKIFLNSKICSLSTNQGRKKYNLKIPTYFISKYKFGKITAGTIKYIKNKVFVNINVEVETSKRIKPKTVVGIDRGIKNPVVASNNLFINNRKFKNIKGRYQHLKKVLQSKGTRSAKRKLKRLAGKERRFVTDFNHCISKQVVNLPFDSISVEKLSIKRTKKNGRKFNKLLGSWSPAQLLQFINYKAELIGKTIINVNCAFTSQACNCCGHITKANRKGSNFQCLKCGFRCHSDLNASRNIACLGKAQLSRLVVNQPNVTCVDVKILKEELKRSIVTSSAF